MTDRRSLDHATHDGLLVSTWVAGDATPVERAAAETLVADCSDCRQLAADLRAVAAAVRDLPQPRRPRDFTLTEADAARLRRRGWRRLLAAFGGPRFDVARPLAVGLTTLGLAGVLLSSVPAIGGPAGGRTGTEAHDYLAVDSSGGSFSNGQEAPGAPESEGPLAGGPAAPSAIPVVGNPRSADGRELQEDGVAVARDPRAASPLAVLSGSFLILGLGLFGLRWTARRLGDG
jgi:anti-sigma factor RsiW